MLGSCLEEANNSKAASRLGQTVEVTSKTQAQHLNICYMRRDRLQGARKMSLSSEGRGLDVNRCRDHLWANS